MGTQSATRIASTVPGVAVTRASAGPTRVAGGQRAAAPVGHGHHLGAAAVNLGGEDEVCRAGAEGGRGPAPVLPARFAASSPTAKLRLSVA